MSKVLPWLVALVCVSGVAFAEEDKEPPAYPLEFKTGYGLPNGKVSTWQGMAKPWPGDRFFTENILVLQPITVTVVARHKGDKIHVALAKMQWDEKHLEGTTGDDGKAILHTRTQGDLRIVVTNADGGEPKPYILVVWIGDEIKPELKPVVTSMKNYKPGAASSAPGASTASGGSNTVGIVIAVILGLGLVVLVLKLKKRGMR